MKTSEFNMLKEALKQYPPTINKTAEEIVFEKGHFFVYKDKELVGCFVFVFETPTKVLCTIWYLIPSLRKTKEGVRLCLDGIPDLATHLETLGVDTLDWYIDAEYIRLFNARGFKAVSSVLIGHFSGSTTEWKAMSSKK